MYFIILVNNIRNVVEAIPYYKLKKKLRNFEKYVWDNIKTILSIKIYFHKQKYGCIK